MPLELPTKEEISEAVREAVLDLMKQELPSLLRKAKRKPWMNTNELMELTGWSRRKIQYLRDERKIPFTQQGKRILYNTDEVEEYFRKHKIRVKGRD